MVCFDFVIVSWRESLKTFKVLSREDFRRYDLDSNLL